MIVATRHIGIVVSDIEKALWFWREVMGLKVAVDFREEDEFIDTVQHLKCVLLWMIRSPHPTAKHTCSLRAIPRTI